MCCYPRIALFEFPSCKCFATMFKHICTCRWAAARFQYNYIVNRSLPSSDTSPPDGGNVRVDALEPIPSSIIDDDQYLLCIIMYTYLYSKYISTNSYPHYVLFVKTALHTLSYFILLLFLLLLL